MSSGRSLRSGFATLAALALVAATVAAADDKEAMVRRIAAEADRYWSAAHDIWEWAEPGYQETLSSERLKGLLRDGRFEIREGVAGIPTAFVASIGSGEPVIGILAEYAALPGLSQKAVPHQEAREETSWGHACGHHLFGVASAAAALALGEEIANGRLQGTVRLYGTPAEEGGGAKVFMVREGLFDDVDAVLHWHPGDANSAGDPTTQARVAAKFRFHGRNAHAASAPEAGRSALDAVNVTNYAAELMREHTPDLSRIHYVITAGGDAPNVVPGFAEVYYYVRHPDAAVASSLYDRLLLCARAGALATETELEVEYLGGVYNVLPNDVLSRVTLGNLRSLADLGYTPEERAFAAEIQDTLTSPRPLDTITEVFDRSGAVSKGSTDVGDVSWVVPTTGLSVATWVPGTPAHSWQAAGTGGTTIARKGMLLAAKVLAATGWDLMRSPEVLAEARAELEERTGDNPYEAMLEDGQAPPLDYRNAPAR
ncbi:MAG: amidohydrolase [Thermoanaerobaculia bacterium]|nr:amidohydrolase [Thermoanaerobaculia bacterium]